MHFFFNDQRLLHEAQGNLAEDISCLQVYHRHLLAERPQVDYSWANLIADFAVVVPYMALMQLLFLSETTPDAQSKEKFQDVTTIQRANCFVLGRAFPMALWLLRNKETFLQIKPEDEVLQMFDTIELHA